MIITRSGLAIATTAVLSVIIGRFFGANELLYLAAMLFGVFTVSAVISMARWPRFQIERHTEPAVSRVGTTTTAQITISTTTALATPPVLLSETNAGLPAVFVQLGSIRRGRAVTLRYPVSSRQRGLFVLGPATLSFSDPLGLFRRTSRHARRDEILIRPELHRVSDPISVLTGPSQDQSVKRLRPASDGHEFFALRPYSVGDDLRRVHWRASARSDDLVVRQTEADTSADVLVVVDVAASSHDADSFERTISAALSVASSLRHSNRPQAIWLSCDTEPMMLGGDDRLNALDIRLARLTPSTSDMGIANILAQTDGPAIVISGATHEVWASIVAVAGMGSPGSQRTRYRRIAVSTASNDPAVSTASNDPAVSTASNDPAPRVDERAPRRSADHRFVIAPGPHGDVLVIVADGTQRFDEVWEASLGQVRANSVGRGAQ